ncbi:glycerate kinase [Leptolyngbya boryana CZ1]|uniref:Glycerate kinase n=1 Tax=Leptolyngbya boryana CZ1 TaxID=3060204 RepID=A0AA97AUQ3_LEPBY|nr:glycerate kinase [Leptolyngbya boryana]WNZ44531.1 glycerate kinase [Leptolyngbya boryana CZ1]
MDIDYESERNRSEFLKIHEAAIVELCNELEIVRDPDTIEKVWLPLAFQIAHWRNAQSRVLIQGFLGGQGTGKTTLTKVLALLLNKLGYSTVSWSLDDLYLPYVDRVRLRTRDPRMIRRGPPGTHDVQLGIEVLQQFQRGEFPIALPRFDKSAHGGEGDRSEPELITQADIILFEGWFVGVRPIVSEFEIVADRQFAQAMNQQLQSYVPLWELLDRFVILYVPEYQLSKQWRKEAEHKMIAQGKAGMGDAEIDEFVEYFWQALHPELFIPPLLKQADLVLEIGDGHSVRSMNRPIETV